MHLGFGPLLRPWQRHFAFAFGRSILSSRNSDGPLMSRRRRWARSSGGAAGSIILSIAFAASSFARLARAADGCLAFVLTVSPSSTRRRVASESVGLSGCFSAHRETTKCIQQTWDRDEAGNGTGHKRPCFG